MLPRRMVSRQQAEEILAACKEGVLSLITPEGMPYGVPVNHFYNREEQSLYFHCAKEGKKMECLLHSPYVSFCAYLPPTIGEERFTTYYQSAIVTGTAHILTDDAEKEKALHTFTMALAPKGASRMDAAIKGGLHAVAVVKITIDTLTGKANLPT